MAHLFRKNTGNSKQNVPDSRSDITLAPYATTATEQLRTMQLVPSQIAALTALLKALPLAIQAIPLLRGTYMLSFTPEIASKITAGAATLMESSARDGVRAIAVNAQGQIIGHGTLVAAQGVQIATAVAGVWQVLAIVTAQHYLPDIQQRLTRIESHIQELRQWIETDEKAKLITSLKLLQQFMDIDRTRSLPQDKTAFWCQHIEHLYLGVAQIGEANQLRLQAQVDHVAHINTADWFNIDQHHKQLSDALTRIDSTIATLLSALVIQIMSVNCLTSLNHYPDLQTQRLRAVLAVLDHRDAVKRTIQSVITTKLSSLGGPIDPWGHDAAKRRSVATHLQQIQKRADSQILEVIRLLDQSYTYVKQQLVLSTMGTSLILDTDHLGNIIRVSTIEQVA